MNDRSPSHRCPERQCPVNRDQCARAHPDVCVNGRQQLAHSPPCAGIADPRQVFAAWDPIHQREIVLLTNILHFGPTTIAAIYKDRWEIELFFKALKQNLKVKSFVGTSRNALLIQIWTALVAMLLLNGCIIFPRRSGPSPIWLPCCV